MTNKQTSKGGRSRLHASAAYRHAERAAQMLGVTVQDVLTAKAAELARNKKTASATAARHAAWKARPDMTAAEIAATGLVGSAAQVAWAVKIRKESRAPADVLERETSAKYWIENRYSFPWRGIQPLMEDVKLCLF